jgi:DNA-binding XRE family transcriptional regulator
MTQSATPGERLRTLRKQLGLTGQAFAEAIGVTKSAVSYWEVGRIALQRSSCLAMERAFAVSADWLLEGNGPMWVPPPSGQKHPFPTLVVRPLLDGTDGFDGNGLPIPPPPSAPVLGLPKDLVQEILAACGGTEEDLFFVRQPDSEMEPTLKEGDWALVHTGQGARTPVVPQMLYLVRLNPGALPTVRRLALTPISGDLLIGLDHSERIPLRISTLTVNHQEQVLGRVCWVGARKLPM